MVNVSTTLFNSICHLPKYIAFTSNLYFKNYFEKVDAITEIFVVFSVTFETYLQTLDRELGIFVDYSKIKMRGHGILDINETFQEKRLLKVDG